jgi:hypothetical protein
MVVTNTGDKAVKPDWKPYAERMNGFMQARNVISGTTKSLNSYEIDAGESLVLELVR